MSKNYLELNKYFPRWIEKIEQISPRTIIGIQKEDSKDDLQINAQFKEVIRIN